MSLRTVDEDVLLPTIRRSYKEKKKVMEEEGEKREA